MVRQTYTNKWGPAKWVVDSTRQSGTATTITTALSEASAGDTIFIKPGTYTENFTLTPGVNLTAYVCDSTTPNVIINGTITMSGAGTSTISGIQLRTNSATFLTVSGSAASIIYLKECYLNCLNNTGISHSSSNSSSAVNIVNCQGDIGTTGIALFTSTSAGNITIYNSYITNSGGSTTASTISTGIFKTFGSFLNSPFSCTSVGSFFCNHTDFYTTGINTTSITTAGSGISSFKYCQLQGGSASALSIGTGTTVNLWFCDVNSTNTNAITGAGTLSYQGTTLSGNSSVINPTTISNSGTLIGSKNTAPSAGFLGEQIRSAVTGVVGSNGITANLTSINLTAGVWDVSANAYVIFTGNATGIKIGISPNTGAFLASDGDSQNLLSLASSAISALGVSVPSYRVVVNTTTTYYLVYLVNFSTGAGTVAGRISATRVG